MYYIFTIIIVQFTKRFTKYCCFYHLGNQLGIPEARLTRVGNNMKHKIIFT